MIAGMIAGWRPYVLVAAIGAVALAGAAGGVWLHGQSQYRAGVAAEAARNTLAAAQAQASAERAARAEENRRVAAMMEIQRNAQIEIDAARVHAADADTAAERLRAQLARLRADSTACRAAVADRGQDQPRADPIGVLIDVLTGMEQAGREIAGYADQLAVAGQACEAAHGAAQ